MEWLLDGKTGLFTYYEYDPAGRVRLQHHPNAAATYFIYDAAGRLSEKVTVKDSDASVLVRFAYTRDAAGNPIAIEREPVLGAFYYEYDGLQRLAYEGQFMGGDREYENYYEYDPAGNRTLLRHGETDAEDLTYYAYDAANELTQLHDAAGWTYFAYDQNGNTVMEQATGGTHMDWGNAMAVVLIGLGLMNGLQAEEQHDFWQAIRDGEGSAVAEVLERNPGLANARSRDGWPPLCLAASEGQAKVVKLLLAAGADLNMAAPEGGNALLESLKGGHKEVAGLLADAGSDYSAQDRDGVTCVLAACAWGYYDIAERLVGEGAGLDVFVGSALGVVDRVKELLDARPGLLRARDPLLNMTPLEWAGRSGRTKLVDILLQRGAEPEDQRTSPGALFWACWSGHEGAVQVLLARDGPVAAKEGPSGVWAASVMGRANILNLLLARGVAIGEGIDGWMFGTPLHVASGFGREDAVRALLAGGARLEATSLSVESPLHLADRAGFLMMNLMTRIEAAESGAKADSFPLPAEWIEQEAPRREVKELLKDVMRPLPPPAGYTPLHWAGHMGRTAICRALLDAGADVDALGLLHDTPLHWAARGGYIEVAEVLLGKGGRVNAGAAQLGTPLCWAARTGQVGMGQLLLERGADISAPDANGRAPLHLAALYGHVGFTRMLLTHGAKANEKDKWGLTPLGTALVQGHKEIVDLLRQHGGVE
jgi:cytohesin